MVDLKGIAQRMRGQETLATEHPVYVVQQVTRIYGVDSDYADGWVYMDEESNTFDPAVEELPEDEECVKVGYKDIWMDVQWFFSAKGAEKYIEAKPEKREDQIESNGQSANVN